MSLPLGDQLRQLRLARGWSQERMAGRLGISRDTLRSLEAGETRPSSRTAAALEREFGDDSRPTDADEIAEVARLWPRVPATVRRATLALLEAASGFSPAHEQAAAAAM